MGRARRPCLLASDVFFWRTSTTTRRSFTWTPADEQEAKRDADTYFGGISDPNQLGERIKTFQMKHKDMRSAAQRRHDRLPKSTVALRAEHPRRDKESPHKHAQTRMVDGLAGAHRTQTSQRTTAPEQVVDQEGCAAAQAYSMPEQLGRRPHPGARPAEHLQPHPALLHRQVAGVR